MKLAVGLVCAVVLAACNTNGKCCKNTDCIGNNICSVVNTCGTDAGEGECLAVCQVDLDCPSGQVCDLVVLSCGCAAASAPGAVGTCAGGVGD